MQRRAGGDAELRFDNVDAGDLLGDRVLDLDARIAFDEVVLAGLRHDQELDRAGVDIVRGPSQSDRVGEELVSRCLGKRRRGRDLDDLLVPSLNGAVPLVQVHDVAAGIGKHLHFDMSRASKQAFHE